MADGIGDISGKITGMFSGLGGVMGTTLTAAFWGILIFLVVGIFGWFMYRGYKNKTFYTTPITLTYLYDNGTQKDRHDLKGGKFVNSRGVWDFKILVPKQRRRKELGYTPDFSKADSDGRICFITSGDGTLWQQYEKKIISKEIKRDDGGLEYEVDLLIKPVPTDIKTVTVNSIKNWRETVDKAKLTAYGIAIGAFIIMVIAHLISLYIQTKIKCVG